MGLDPNSTENVKVSDRVDLEIMTGVVGLLGGAMGVMREGRGEKERYITCESCCSTPGLEL